MIFVSNMQQAASSEITLTCFVVNWQFPRFELSEAAKTTGQLSVGWGIRVVNMTHMIIYVRPSHLLKLVTDT